MKFRTEIEISKSSIEINHQTKMMMIGSCFTNSIGHKLIDNKFNTNLNPFGTLYNPASISRTLNLLLTDDVFSEADIFKNNGLYNSFNHHSSFSNNNKDEFLTEINKEQKRASKRLKESDILFITFGTSYVYQYLKTKEIVGNCHKLPSSDFKRYRLTIESIVEEWSKTIQKLKEVNSNIHVIFTVSPIRHLRDGANDNQLSKATLLLAIEKLNELFDNTSYFPSYEIVLDDLRDYRFYESDMSHPNSLAIEYIWSIFKDAYITNTTETTIAEWNRIKLAIDHRPFNQDSEEHIRFLKQTLLKLNNFGAKYPYICLDYERKLLENRIN